jgi:hypothetical protein
VRRGIEHQHDEDTDRNLESAADVDAHDADDDHGVDDDDGADHHDDHRTDDDQRQLRRRLTDERDDHDDDDNHADHDRWWWWWWWRRRLGRVGRLGRRVGRRGRRVGRREPEPGSALQPVLQQAPRLLRLVRPSKNGKLDRWATFDTDRVLNVARLAPMTPIAAKEDVARDGPLPCTVLLWRRDATAIQDRASRTYAPAFPR